MAHTNQHRCLLALAQGFRVLPFGNWLLLHRKHSPLYELVLVELLVLVLVLVFVFVLVLVLVLVLALGLRPRLAVWGKAVRLLSSDQSDELELLFKFTSFDINLATASVYGTFSV